MRNKPEIIRTLAKRKRGMLMRQSAWVDVVIALSALKPREQTAMVDLIKAGQSNKVGVMVINAVKENIITISKKEVTSALVDNVLTLDEIDDLL